MALLAGATAIRARIVQGNGKSLGSIDFPDWERSRPGVYETHWNHVSKTDPGKWSNLEPSRDTYDWEHLDIIYDYCRANGFDYKWHTPLFWLNKPGWTNNLSDGAMRGEIEEMFRDFMNRYPNTTQIDVVNEVLTGLFPGWDALGGAGTTGYDAVIEAFRIARRYAPDAELLINEINVLKRDDKTTEYAGLVALLRSEGVIDGVGLQGHFLESTSTAKIRENLNEIKAAAGSLPIYITELDINRADDQQQLEQYQRIFPIFWEDSQVKGITLWGYGRGATWRGDSWLYDPADGGSERPALTWLRDYVRGGGTSEFVPNPNKWYLLTNEEHGRELDANNACNDVFHFDGTGQDKQWRFESSGDGYYFLINRKCNKKLDADDGLEADLAQVTATFPDKRWKLVSSPSSGYYFIVNKETGEKVDTDGTNTVDLAPATTSAKDKRWRPVAVGNYDGVADRSAVAGGEGDDAEAFAATVVPNPAGASVQLVIDDLERIRDARLYDGTGRLARQLSRDDLGAPIDLGAGAPGIYLLALRTTGGRTRTLSFVKR